MAEKKEGKQVYFITDEDSEHVKIGIAKNPEKRLGSLQVGNPKKLRIIYLISGLSDQLASDFEKEIHDYLFLSRVQGEWFRYDFSVYDVIDHLRTKGHGIEEIQSPSYVVLKKPKELEELYPHRGTEEV